MFSIVIKLNWPSGPIQSLSCYVCQSCVGVFVPSQKTRFLVDCRLLVRERIANIGIPLDIFNDFLRFEIFWGVRVFVTSLLRIMGELAGVGSLVVAVGLSDK